MAEQPEATPGAESLWPSHFPKGVPPAEAVAAEGTTFRLVDSVPPTPTDFKSQYELLPNRDFGTSIAIAHGVSFHGDLDDSKRTRKRFKPLRGKKIATGALAPAMGKMKNTPAEWAKSHLTVWFHARATPHRSTWTQVPG